MIKDEDVDEESCDHPYGLEVVLLHDSDYYQAYRVNYKIIHMPDLQSL
jgi:hypothetical protein